MKKINVFFQRAFFISALISVALSCSIQNQDSLTELTQNYSEAKSRGITGISDDQTKADMLSYLNLWFNDYYKVNLNYGYIRMSGEGNVENEVSTSEAIGYALRLSNYKYNLDKNPYYYKDKVVKLKNTIDAFDFVKTNTDGLTYKS